MLYKSLKDTNLNYSDMFRITQDPSSGSDNLYLTEITHNGSVVFIMCMVGVWRHIVDLCRVCMLCWSGSHSGSQTRENPTTDNNLLHVLAEIGSYKLHYVTQLVNVDSVRASHMKQYTLYRCLLMNVSSNILLTG